MSDVTVEEIIKAAEIVNRLIRSQCTSASEQECLVAADIALRRMASREETKDEWIDRLVDEPGLNLSIRQARILIERYPALLDS